MAHLKDVLARLRAVKDPSELATRALAELPPFGEAALAPLAALVEKTQTTDEADLRLVLEVTATRIHADAARSPDAFWTAKIQEVLLYFHDHDRFGPLRPAFSLSFLALPDVDKVRLAHCIEHAWSAGLVVSLLPQIPAAWPILLGRIERLELERFSSLGEMLGSALVSLGPDVVPLVKERLGRASADGNEVFARALAVLRTEEAILGLVTLLGHGSKAVRATALEMLRGLGPLARAALEDGSASKKKAIREASASLLGALEKTTDSPLDDTLAAIRRDAARGASAVDLAALAWEELIAQPDNYKSRGDVESVIRAARGPDVERIAAISVDGLTRCRPSSPSPAKEIEKAIAPLGEALVKPLSAALEKGDFPLRGVALDLLVPYAKDVAIELWIAALGDAGKTIRQTAKEALAARGGADAAAIVPLLAAKKADVRLAAAEALEAIATPELGAAIAAAIAAETDGKVTIVLERITARIGISGQTASVTDPGEDPKDVLALLVPPKNGKFPKLLAAIDLPLVHLERTGAALSAEAMLALVLHSMNEGPDMEDPVLRRVRPALDDADASALSKAIFQAWQAAGSEAKHKWCVYQRGVLASREELCENAFGLDILTSTGHHHLAGWYLDCLARHGRVPGQQQTIDEGLSWVAHWAAEAETRSLEKHARALLAKERTIRGLSGEDFRRAVDNHVADDDADRRAPLRHADDVLAKEARRIEDAMVGGREWLGPAFRWVLAHPVLGALFSGLLCRARDGEKEIWFRPMNGGGIDGNHKAFEIPLGAVVTVPHKLEIPERVLAAWKNHFSSAGITQPFQQLDREVFTEPESLDPLDRTMKRAALAARLREHGLRHGTPEDAGLFHYSYKRFRGRHVVATFWHGAISIRSGQDFSIEPVGISSVSFEDGEGRRMKPADVHPVVRSEVARLLQGILA